MNILNSGSRVRETYVVDVTSHERVSGHRVAAGTACKVARLEQLKARRAHSRERFDVWTEVATKGNRGESAVGVASLGRRMINDQERTQ